MKKGKEIIRGLINIKNIILASMISGYVSIATSSTALATGFTLSNGGASAESIGNSIIDKIIGPLRIAGGVCIVFAIAFVAIGLIATSKNPVKREQMMSTLLWIGGGSLLLGMVMVISTFFFNLGA